MTPQEQVLMHAKAVLSQAAAKYNLNMDNVQIRFDLKGRCAGQAYRRGSEHGMRFNRDMLTREAFDHVHNDTVPHEVAHIVCFMNRSLGNGHDAGWANVCRALGGTGKTTHSEEVVYGKGRTYEYVTSSTKTVRISQQIHNKIQAGSRYTFRRGLGIVDKSCAYSIVGVAGRTLAAPIVKAPTVQAPAIIVVPAVVEVEQPLFHRAMNKAAAARSVMLAGHNRGHSYEEIVQAIMLATGHDRQLSRSYYKGNYVKVGVPAPQ